MYIGIDGTTDFIFIKLRFCGGGISVAAAEAEKEEESSCKEIFTSQGQNRAAVLPVVLFKGIKQIYRKTLPQYKPTLVSKPCMLVCVV